MANITNVQPPTALEVSTNVWVLSVTYTATFSEFEVANNHFEDSIQLVEHELAGEQQIIDDWRNDEYFNPASTSVVRTKTIAIRESILNTELGNEEISFNIRLRNLNLNTRRLAGSPVLVIGV